MSGDACLPTGAWDDVHVGKALGAREVEVTDELLQRFCEGAVDRHPWYTSSDNPFGHAVAPALIASQEPWRFSGWYAGELRGNLHVKQEWDLFRPIPAGATYVSRATITERYPWRANRHVVVNEVHIADPDGVLYARGRTHQSFLRAMVDGDVVSLEREREKRNEPAPDAGAGAVETIDGDAHLMTPELCLAAADGLQNYHSDPEIARAMGFPAVVVQGVFNSNIISALMTARFGAGWWIGGRMRLAFTNPIWGGDTVSAHVAVREMVEESPRRRALCQAWVTKADGTVTAAGDVSAVVAAP